MSRYPVQGQPFSSGPVWDRMRFDSGQSASTMPLAGTYLDKLQTFFSTMPSNLSSDDRMLYGLLGAQSLGAQETAKQNKEMMREWMAYQENAAQKANEMGIRNTVIGSFLKDVPAAISNAFAQRQRYTPEQIEIAARAMQGQPRGYQQRNYYGFVG